jgi:hypothetical protein
MTMGLTAGQLISMLQEFPENALVIVSSDAEGNRLKPLAAISVQNFFMETYEGFITEGADDPEVAVLWPV